MKKKAATSVFFFVVLFSCFCSSKRSTEGDNYVDKLVIARTAGVDSLFVSQDLVTSFHSEKKVKKIATPFSLRKAIRDTLSRFLKADFSANDSLLLKEALQTIDIAAFIVPFDDKASLAIFHVRNIHLGNKYFLYPYIDKKLPMELVPFVWDGQNIQDDEAGFDASFRLVQRPYLQKLDINKDGTKELILQNRNHNGTAWNGVSQYYFSLTQFPKIEPVFYLENKSEFAIDKRSSIERALELSNDGKRAAIHSFRNKKSIGHVILFKKESKWEMGPAKASDIKELTMLTSDAGGEQAYFEKLNAFTQHTFGPH